mgnify:CR=1 FL=1
MTETRYSFREYNREKMACAVGRDLPISTKQSIEICNMIRGMDLARARRVLEEVTSKKTAVPFKRFNDGVGHRKGKIAAGRYPVKTSLSILEIVKSAQTNAQQKGLNTGDMSIKHAAAQKASTPLKFGRHRGREAKRTHIEIVAGEHKGEETKGAAKEKKSKKAKDDKTGNGKSREKYEGSAANAAQKKAEDQERDDNDAQKPADHAKSKNPDKGGEKK